MFMNNKIKKLTLVLALVAALGFIGCQNDTKNEPVTSTTKLSNDMAMIDLSFGVRGNCEMCKTTIEKAAKSVIGVKKANWDVDKKTIDVTYDEAKVNANAIHNAIAAAGYDTEEVKGDEEAYSNLPNCCQYTRDMEMNQSEKMTGHKDEDYHN